MQMIDIPKDTYLEMLAVIENDLKEMNAANEHIAALRKLNDVMSKRMRLLLERNNEMAHRIAQLENAIEAHELLNELDQIEGAIN